MRAAAIAVSLLLATMIFASLVPSGVDSEGEPSRITPSPPRNFTAESNDRQIVLRWEEPLDNGDSPRIGFVLYRGASPSTLEVHKPDLGPFVFSYADKNLNNGQIYYYSIAAINEMSGVGDATEVIMTKPVGRPSPPRNISYDYSSRRIDFEWLPPLEDGGDEIIGYYLLRGPNQDASDVSVELGNVMSYSDTTVSNGVVYFYRFIAFNGYTNGSASEPFQITPRGKPSAPGNFNVTPLDRQVQLNWSYPADDGGGTVMGYNIYRGLTEETMVFYQYVSSRTGYLDTNITNGLSYHYAVAAKNSEGFGEWTEVVMVTPIGIPDSPLNLTIDPGDTKVHLEWREPEDNGGTEILGYNVYRTIKGEPMKLIADAGLSMMYTDENLTNGNVYYYQVKAYNAQGVGFPSQTVDVKPDFSPTPPENFRMTELDSYLKLMWALPPMVLDYPVLEFRLYRGITDDDLQLIATMSPTDSTYEDREVEVGVEYHYQLTAVSKIGEGQPSGMISGVPYTTPSLIRNLEADASDKLVTLSWNPPEFTGGRDIVNYKVFRGENRDSMAVIDVISGTLTAYNDTNVVNGVTYYYSIMAVNQKTDGNLSSPIEADPLGPPGSPRNLIVSVLGDSILLEWEQPRLNGGRTITGYIILRGPSQLNLSRHDEVDFVQNNYTDTDAEKGQTYYYAVIAKNDIGEGRQSNAATGKIPLDKTTEKEEDNLVPILIGVLAVVIIGIGLIVFAVIMSKRKGSEEDEGEVQFEESDKEREHRLVLERRAQMKEFTDVALTTDEAHAHDHDQHDLSYEDLYGNIPSLEDKAQTEQPPVPEESAPAETQSDFQMPSEEAAPAPQPAPMESSEEGAETTKEAEPEYIPPEAPVNDSGS
ncbi:MAG: fibronectin type III domain-containing protein [Thermoplasmatota archaeon]